MAICIIKIAKYEKVINVHVRGSLAMLLHINL